LIVPVITHVAAKIMEKVGSQKGEIRSFLHPKKEA